MSLDQVRKQVCPSWNVSFPVYIWLLAGQSEDWFQVCQTKRNLGYLLMDHWLCLEFHREKTVVCLLVDHEMNVHRQDFQKCAQVRLQSRYCAKLVWPNTHQQLTSNNVQAGRQTDRCIDRHTETKTDFENNQLPQVQSGCQNRGSHMQLFVEYCGGLTINFEMTSMDLDSSFALHDRRMLAHESSSYNVHVPTMWALANILGIRKTNTVLYCVGGTHLSKHQTIDF